MAKEKKQVPDKKFAGDLLKKEEKKTEKLTKSKARYWCFRFQTEATGGNKATEAPKGFKEFVEDLHGFTEWEKFAISWDLRHLGDNSFMIVNRVLSVWQEWDHIMDRVAIPVDSTPAEVEARVEALTKEYARKYGS